ncbi:DUF817 family protein [Streptomyces chartreusis]
MLTIGIIGPLGAALRQLLEFAWLQTRSCAFAIALMSGVAASTLLPGLPVARYDLLVVYGVLLTLLFWLRGWENGRDVGVIAVCHVIGLAFELVKVSLGSWSYPEPAVLKFAGVPLYGGFLYAAVGSYICRAWQLFDLELVRYRPRSSREPGLGLRLRQAEVALHGLEQSGGGGCVGRRGGVVRRGLAGAARGQAAEQQECGHAGVLESAASQGSCPSSFQQGGVEQPQAESALNRGSGRA